MKIPVRHTASSIFTILTCRRKARRRLTRSAGSCMGVEEGMFNPDVYGIYMFFASLLREMKQFLALS